MSYTSSLFSPYLGALELQFALSPFYTFVALYRMVLYQLKSIELNDYILIYGQNKNRGFTKILTAIPLKTQHSPLFFFFLQPFIKTNSTNQDNTKQPQTLALGTRSKPKNRGNPYKGPIIHTKKPRNPNTLDFKTKTYLSLVFFSFSFFFLFFLFFSPFSSSPMFALAFVRQK